jgi:hypothetical protein
MTSLKSIAKAAAVIGGATLLAVAVQAQNSQSSGNSADFDWFLRFQTSASTGGTTTGSTGGTGGIIIGATPRPLSEVVVVNPSLFTKP